MSNISRQPVDVALDGAQHKLDDRWYTPCMEKLDALPWIDAFSVGGYGARIGVRVSDPALIPQLARRLAPGAQLSGFGRVDRMLSVIRGGATARKGVRAFNLVYADHLRVGRSHDLDVCLDIYDTHLRLGLAQFSRQAVFVHCGAVGWKGRAILIPGRTLSGKTHLVAELVKAGATYLSDEYAVLDAAGLVHPFAKALSLRETPTSRQHDISAEELGGSAAREPLPVGLVLITNFSENARWQPKRISAASGALELLSHSIAARMEPARVTQAVAAVATKARFVVTDRPDSGDVLPQIVALAEAGDDRIGRRHNA